MSRFVPSDRAIESPEDDLFKRSSFVNRLVSSLVVDYEHYSIAAGVTVGLIGPWGTGKSSILNLIERELAAQYPNSICVRFNPWLVSGHQELIGQFFSEFVSVLQGNRELRTNAYELIDDLKAYGRLIGGIADLALPGLGVFPNGLAGLLERQILRGRSLEALHTSISDSLGRIRVPVVVLIDELDRVEDAEVRAVARLINAVAGFPRVSYLVAYDWERVTEALDGGVSNRGRGRRYLEKIIQHQVAMPDLSSVEVTDFFQDALDGYSAELSLPESYSDDDRYKRLLFIVVPGIISTLRDAKRVVGSFSILRRIVGAEVNWVDLLGWVVICEKYPDVRRSILDHQEYVAEDAFTRMYLAWRQSDGKSKDASDHLEAIGVSDSEEFYSESLVGLLGLLFPSLNKLGEEKDRVVLPLASQRGLGLVSRYGLSERDVSIRVIDEFMNADLENQLSMLQSLHIGENLVAFLDQMEEFHAEFSREQRLRFWVSFSAFLRDNQPVPPPVSEAFYIYSETAAQALLRLLAHGAAGADEVAGICRTLLKGGDTNVLPYFLRAHFFHYGMYGRPRRSNEFNALADKVVEELAKEFSNQWTDELLSGRLLHKTWSSSAVLCLFEVFGEERLEVPLWPKPSKEDLVAFTCLFFRSNHVLEMDSLQKFVDPEMFIRFAQEIAESDVSQEKAFLRESANHALSWLNRLGDVEV